MLTAHLGAFLAFVTLFLPWRAAALNVPYLSGPVVDEVGLLSAPERATVEALLLRLEESGRAQMAVLITRSLQGLEIEDYTIRVAERWKLGKKGKDNGLVLVIAPEDRKLRLEVGYGLEGDIPDATAKQIVADTIRPYFREGRYGDGLLVAIEAIARKLQVPLEAPLPQAKRIRTPPSSFRPSLGLSLLILFAFFILFGLSLFSAFTRPFRRYRGYPGGWGGGWGGGSWGSGSWGGGGWSGGGGGFGGGGASSSW